MWREKSTEKKGEKKREKNSHVQSFPSHVGSGLRFVVKRGGQEIDLLIPMPVAIIYKYSAKYVCEYNNILSFKFYEIVNIILLCNPSGSNITCIKSH